MRCKGNHLLERTTSRYVYFKHTKMSDFRPNPLSKCLSAAPNSWFEVKQCLGRFQTDLGMSLYTPNHVLSFLYQVVMSIVTAVLQIRAANTTGLVYTTWSSEERCIVICLSSMIYSHFLAQQLWMSSVLQIGFGFRKPVNSTTLQESLLLVSS